MIKTIKKNSRPFISVSKSEKNLLEVKKTVKKEKEEKLIKQVEELEKEIREQLKELAEKQVEIFLKEELGYGKECSLEEKILTLKKIQTILEYHIKRMEIKDPMRKLLYT